MMGWKDRGTVQQEVAGQECHPTLLPIWGTL